MHPMMRQLNAVYANTGIKSEEFSFPAQSLVTAVAARRRSRVDSPGFLVLLVALGLAGCAVPTKPPPQVIAPDFSFSPPSPSGSRVDMTIALIKPSTPGSMFTEYALAEGSDMVRVRRYVDEMLTAAKTDMEKILVARGFNTVGPFDSIDEMTYSQKERSSLILTPLFEVKMDFVGGAVRDTGGSRVSQDGAVSMRGRVSLAFLEPMTQEKVWLKHFSLEQLSAPYTVSVQARKPDPTAELIGALLAPGSQPKNDQVEAAVKVLNEFYQSSMMKMANLLDTHEILQLKADAEKLKGLKRY